MRPVWIYAALCVPGALLPLSAAWPWLMEHGLDAPLFVRELFSTRIGAFFGWDVIVSAVALLAFMRVENRRARVRHSWVAVAGLFLVGVSFALPLFLALREGRVTGAT